MAGADREAWSRVTELFGAVFEAPPEERRRLLEARTAGQDTLRRRVEELLAAHDAEGGALDRPALDSLDGLDPTLLAPTPSLVGRSVGPWRVVREVARGGMGTVYEGVRADAQFEQRVAIKTLRSGADSETLLRRFRQERRILAGLQHPHIAALFDGGVTEDGLPYFVLEFVDGEPIDRYCAGRSLGLAARLDLFRQVVAAVQYAHRQLVIHRDLKPGNVLVTHEGVVKLVDFGIAKLLQPDGAEVTVEGRTPLTLNYASPEQVRGEPISTATDVYSLGAVLYQLLTGRPPLEIDPLSLARAVSVVSEVTPPPPSTVAPDARIGRALRGDLDAIVMMALRKEPDRRYPTVQSLGDDLQRYLRGLPVGAAPDSVAYRIRTFVRRRKALTAALAVGVVSISAGTAISLWQARAAREEARRAALVSGFLTRMIGAGEATAATAGVRLGPQGTLADLVDSAARRAPIELADDPEVRSAVHLALGRSYTAQGRWTDAQAQYDSTIRVLDRLGGGGRTERYRALAAMAELELLRGGSRTDSLAQAAAAGFERAGLRESVEYARALRLSGMAHALAGRWHQADSLLRASLALHRRLSRLPTADLAITTADLAGVQEAMGMPWPGLDSAYQRAIAMFDSIPNPDVVEKGTVLWYAARREVGRGNLAGADSLSLEGLRILEWATGPESQFVAQQLVQLAEHARYRGDTAAARARLGRAMEIVRLHPEMNRLVRDRVLLENARFLWATHRLGGADSSARAAYQSRLAAGNIPYLLEAAQLFGAVLRDEGRFAESEAVLVDAWKRLTPATESSRFLLAATLTRLYHAWGRPAAAAPYSAALPDSLVRAIRDTYHRR